MADRRREIDVPHSRLFVRGSKELGEDEVREAFEAFGFVKSVRAVKDRNLGENRGIFFVKFEKTSEAAAALEELNGKPLGGRILRVVVAASSDPALEVEQTRLFVDVSKSSTDDDLYNYFSQFGELEYATTIRNKETNESKGFAFVKFRKFSDAARAYEQCDRKYKARFANPPKPKEDFRTPYPMDMPSRNNGPHFNQFRPDGVYKVLVTAPPSVNQDRIWRLFDIVPGLTYCQPLYDNDRGRPSNCFEVTYNNLEWAELAVNKLHGFEYPPGQRLVVRFANPSHLFNSPGGRPGQIIPGGRPGPIKRSAASLEPQFGEPSKSDLLKLAETLAQANSLIKKAGLDPDLLQSNSRNNFCSVDLPDPMPLAKSDSVVEARCFIKCYPMSLSPPQLRDVFCRFGDLIDVYMLGNKNCGYARYASRESAMAAIKTLNEADVFDIHLKVIEADDLPEKKAKMY